MKRIVAGKYELAKLLGQGGMGEVWVANELATGRQLALKLMNAAAADSKEHRARFEREARIASTLVSPHIAQVTDSGLDEEGNPFMALELLHGEDLAKRIKTEKSLPLAQVVRIAIQVGRALHVAHSAGLVHRDLKPANIFLARQGDEEIVKVLDFGIAKTGAMDSTQYTAAGAMLGTASYMSPEQIRNAKAVDHRADLWAFAVVLFRALTGELPFPQTGFDLFLALAQDPIPTPQAVTSFVPGLPPPLNVFFERSFVHTLEQRYPSASAMVVGFCRAAGVTVPPDVLYASDSRTPPSFPVPSAPAASGPAPSAPVPSAPAPSAPAPSAPLPPVANVGLDGTMMLDVLPVPSPPAGAHAGPVAAPPSLDPDEPDNAATLFYQPAPKDLPSPPAGNSPHSPPGLSAGAGRSPVFTYPLDAARAAAASAPDGQLEAPRPAVASIPEGQMASAGEPQARSGPARATAMRGGRGSGAGIWILVMVVLLIAIVVGAVVFLR